MSIYKGTTGPQNAKLAIVGEAFGAQEEEYGQAFSGPTGQWLNRTLAELRIPRPTVFATNVVNARPMGNDIWRFMHPRDEGTITYKGLNPRPILMQGIENLKAQLNEVKPDVVIACGNLALWALTDDSFSITKSIKTGYNMPAGITHWRGSQIFTSNEFGNLKLLPLVHPTNCLRPSLDRVNWKFDIKTRLGRRDRWDQSHLYKFVIDLPFSGYCDQINQLIDMLDAGPRWIACDIETNKQYRMVCIGFAWSNSEATCIPVGDWPLHDDIKIRMLLRKLLMHPNLRLIGQGFMYDRQHLLRELFLSAPLSFDTMVAMHVLYPNRPRRLDYISSIYCDWHRFWKEDAEVHDWSPKKWSVKKLHWYNCEDCVRTYEVASNLLADLRKRALVPQFQERMAIEQLAFRMYKKGVRYSEEAARPLLDDLEAAHASIVEILMRMNPREPGEKGANWYASPKKQMELLYDVLKIKPVEKRRGKRGDATRTVGKDALDILMVREPWLTPMLVLLKDVKRVSHIMGVINSTRDDDGRWRSTFRTAATVTFRWACKKTGYGTGLNLQNLTEGDGE